MEIHHQSDTTWRHLVHWPLMLVALLLILTIPAANASDKARTDSVFTFRFVPGKDMFYSPWGGNGAELDRLVKAIGANREAIERGQMYLCVTSHATTGAKRTARVRRLRVKSELITRAHIAEDHFVTDRDIATPYADSLRDVVVVILPAPIEKVAQIAGPEAAARVESYIRSTMPAEPEEPVARPVTSPEPKPDPEPETVIVPAAPAEAAPAVRMPGRVSLRANLLRWATLTPDLGIEWRIIPSVGIAVSSSWTSWSWDSKQRRYALWEVMPELRWYIGQSRSLYLGAMYKTGEFNYKLSHTGREGHMQGGGITGGWQLRLNNALSLDFALGLGCIHAAYDRYTVTEGVRVKSGRSTKNWWGPTHAGVTLVWHIL